MKWEGNRESDNVEDRRGEDDGGGGGFGFGGRSIGIGTIVVALLGSYVFGVSPVTILNLLSGAGGPVHTSQGPAHAPPADDRTAKFASVVLADTEDTWSALFREQGANYARPKLVLYSGSTPTACGTGQSATGPFYCPGDQKVYLDLDFFNLMRQRFKVSSEFAEAYVIAHEVGHHVQNLMGLTAKVDHARRSASERQANALSVRLELQADCFAGVWAYHANQTRKILEQGDVEAALKTASAIGDDALQRQARGEVVPDSFTHGTSEQRVRWFSKGLDQGEIAQCNTFEARQL
ncbi:KPN_02809 family neutral zinc metallopeptidase [Janthinobacterium agaricidamnosum]|uniref:Neutral zinc metallopeptidase family protein n=1 Tax=Janthinobacterium agaricidamnosum NBRC 102515 = DSM 9628 TaxID=1349767 RepID=W0V521_9BURK|nr:neutral zinc metallopeptidase [Janthinobacterium agaricidamnosum]CDG82956.1 neutral zinc metallopeptidase family protein [Janthinobacterium agaricidamnosum NBRC 102515 = DSM 9628]